MGGFKVLVQTVGGVEKQYFIPINDADGDNGLLDDDANIERLEHLVDGQVTDYWWSHASGTGDIVDDNLTEIFNANMATFSAGKYFTTPNNGSLSISQTHTIVTGASVLGSDRTIDSNYENDSGALDDGGYFLGLVTDGRLRLVAQSNTNQTAILFSPVLASDTEYALGWSYDNSTDALALFVDGVKVDSTTFTNGITTNVAHRQIGAFGGALSFDGSIMNARTWNVAKSDQDMIDMTGLATSVCDDLLTDDQKIGLVQSLPLCNYNGFVGQELVDQTGIIGNAVDVGSVPFTGTAQIECGQYTPLAPLWFTTKDVSPITSSITTTSGTSTVLSAGSTEGTVVSNSPTFNYGDPSVEHLVEFTDIDPLDVTQIDFNGDGLQVTSDLGLLTQLTFLSLSNNQLTDIGDISTLTQLADLRLYDNQLTDIGDISTLTQLTILSLYSNQLTDIGDISTLTQLADLRLYDNQLTDIGDISTLTQLTILSLYSNQLTDIGDISTLTQLADLRLYDNQLTDIGDISTLNQLTVLRLNNNQLTDIGDISTLTQLAVLYLSDNQLTDIGGIGSASLTTIRIENNALIQTCVDQVINDVDSLGASNGTLNLSGGTNSAPSGASSTALANLITKGWTVTTN